MEAEASPRVSVGGRSSMSELDTRDLQDFLADDYVETYEGPPPRTPARAGSATEAWAGGGDGAAGGGGVVVLEPRRRVSTSTRAHARVDGAGRRLVNGYELLGEVGRGAFGRVEVCCDCGSGRVYAAKILRKPVLARQRRGSRESALADARREIAIMKKLEHPNLVSLVEVIDDPRAETLYVILEYVDCGPILAPGTSSSTLYEAIDDAAARCCCRDVIRGLEYLHFQGVVHRDVKPENVLLTSGGVAKLCDFGVSRLSSRETRDAAAFFASTPAFAAPELCGFGAPAASALSSPAVDVWSLGATLHAMVAGEPPVARGTPARTRARKARDVGQLQSAPLSVVFPLVGADVSTSDHLPDRFWNARARGC